ncbi:MAG: YdcF family protein, partial [Candidatus Omnitrophota bacterium]|nr:YdcF family protein [Candidatus Omnitrophota bacterium]
WPALVGYALLFHTPAVWWAAQPLSLKGMPVRADAIVVFAGGVGESGQAGQGYQERVEHAVSLYRQGLAPLLLFSSGYSYTFKEAEVMKALAVSLGVPAEAIILEESAGNTRENVRLSAALLRTKGFDSVLVVSSPYHMRRASLVWRKEAPDIAAIWTPILYSHFFGDRSHVKLRHVQAIAHEYLGILYYWWKGWM